MNKFPLKPIHAELIAALISRGIDSSICLTEEEITICEGFANYLRGIKDNAFISAERAQPNAYPFLSRTNAFG